MYFVSDEVMSKEQVSMAPLFTNTQSNMCNNAVAFKTTSKSTKSASIFFLILRVLQELGHIMLNGVKSVGARSCRFHYRKHSKMPIVSFRSIHSLHDVGVLQGLACQRALSIVFVFVF